ncbi:hypothetical protein EYF80_011792 [Liparis tanakae]|uniref:Uncharacterized protein n=1 Tax=Liparis tanakae TaxID=230148 RepID=A0A4Z2IJN1_9TELE|nr:hypothetical protein EYF80_011792 [Liparis tanakae]
MVLQLPRKLPESRPYFSHLSDLSPLPPPHLTIGTADTKVSKSSDHSVLFLLLTLRPHINPPRLSSHPPIHPSIHPSLNHFTLVPFSLMLYDVT